MEKKNNKTTVMNVQLETEQPIALEIANWASHNKIPFDSHHLDNDRCTVSLRGFPSCYHLDYLKQLLVGEDNPQTTEAPKAE